MGRPNRGKPRAGGDDTDPDLPKCEDIEIKATLLQLLQNTKGIPALTTEVPNLKTQVNKTNDILIPGLQTQLATLEKNLKEASGDIEVQDARLEDLDTCFNKLEEKNRELQLEIDQLKAKPTINQSSSDEKVIEDKIQMMLRRHERQTHLLFDGIAENPNENLLEQIGLVLYDTQLNLNRSTVTKVYRLGTINEKNWRPRPIVVEFDSKDTRDQVFRACFNLKTNPNCENVWINERLNDQQETQRMELRALSDLAKENHREARVVGDVLIVSGIKHKHADIQNLPDDVNLEDAFTRIDGDHIFFNLEHSYLSAFYPVEFVYKKQKYQTAEQAHAHRKAKDNFFQPKLKAQSTHVMELGPCCEGT